MGAQHVAIEEDAISGVTFTEAELDAAAQEMARGALYECPDRIYDFLTESQLDGLRTDLRDAIKTALLFDLMNHLKDFDQ